MGLFEGQVAWVTGAGRGIGRAVALALAVQGAAVALVSRTQDEIEQVAQEIRSRGGTAIAKFCSGTVSSCHPLGTTRTIGEGEGVASGTGVAAFGTSV